MLNRLNKLNHPSKLAKQPDPPKFKVINYARIVIKATRGKDRK